MDEYWEMIDAAMAVPERYGANQEEFAGHIYDRLVRYGCKRWARPEVLALVIAWDNRPTPEGTVSFTIRL